MPLQAEAEGKSGHGRGIFFWGTVTVLARSVEVTGLLKAWSGGDQAALERLADQVYNELRRIAGRYMRNERTGNTLQTTAVVNEVYLRLVDVKNVDWQQRAQFFTIAAQMMRRILVDAARARGSHKRGGGAVKVWTKRWLCRRSAIHRLWRWMRRWKHSQSWLPARLRLSSCATSAAWTKEKLQRLSRPPRER